MKQWNGNGLFKRMACGPLLLLLLLVSSQASAVSTFERLFSDGQGHFERLQTPDDILSTLQSATISSTYPYIGPPGLEYQSPLLQPRYMMIPQSRSPDPATFAQPRMLFFMPLTDVTLPIPYPDRDALRDRRTTLNDQLFIGATDIDGKRQVISWDTDSGRFEFFEGTPDHMERANRSTCLHCHQNEAPIFTRGPWAESAADIRMAAHMCEAHPDGIYQGVRFVTDCACGTFHRKFSCHPTALTDPFPTNKNPYLFSSVVELDGLVRLANQRNRARNACQSMCGEGNSKSTLACRRGLIEAALLFPGMAAWDGQRLPKLEDIRSRAKKRVSATDAQYAHFQSLMSSALDANWEANQGFEYISSILADRDPSTNIMTNMRPKGGKFFDFGEPAAFNVQKKTLDLFSLEKVETPIPAGELYKGTAVDPATDRRAAIVTGRIPREMVLDYALDEAFECLGFNVADLEEIKEAKKSGALDTVFHDPHFREFESELAEIWPLSSQKHPSEQVGLRERVMNTFRELSHSSIPREHIPLVQREAESADNVSLPTAAAVLNMNNENLPQKVETSLQMCISCHRPYGEAARYNFLNKSGVLDLTVVKSLKYSGAPFINQAIKDIQSDIMPPAHTVNLNSREKSILSQTLQSWMGAGMPVSAALQ
jgi:hypothetical protein